MHLTVILPSYRRPQDLEKCLAALFCQERMADEILVVVQARDLATNSLLDETPYQREDLRRIIVHQPGLGHAIAEGLKAAQTDVAAFTDDDARPRTDWLKSLEAHYADPQVAAVGGRDRIHLGGGKILDERAEEVGIIGAEGFMIGNHHAGFGAARDVDILKGVNMSYRMAALDGLGPDPRLLGKGATVGTEPSLCLPLRKAGWRVVYDPAVLVEHHAAIREDGTRSMNNLGEIFRSCHNHYLTLFSYVKLASGLKLTLKCLLRGGNRKEPGLLGAIWLLLQGDFMAPLRAVFFVSAVIAAWLDLFLRPRKREVAAPPRNS